MQRIKIDKIESEVAPAEEADLTGIVGGRQLTGIYYSESTSSSGRSL